MNWQKKWTLIDADLKEVKMGRLLADSYGDVCTFITGIPPHKTSSTGKVSVTDASGELHTYYPGVFNLKWRKYSG